MTAYEEIKEKCSELDVSISSICKEASVDRQLVERWKKQDPKSIVIYNKLIGILNDKQQEFNDKKLI
jgi:predicted regulator of amino acid metabolism with ACT domain